MLVAVFITFESPLSGTSMNPARSFASAVPGGDWTFLWIYLSAPFLGMLAAVDIYHLLKFSTARMCAKLIVSDMDKAYAHLRRHNAEHASPEPQRLPDWNANAGGI